MAPSGFYTKTAFFPPQQKDGFFKVGYIAPPVRLCPAVKPRPPPIEIQRKGAKGKSARGLYVPHKPKPDIAVAGKRG